MLELCQFKNPGAEVVDLKLLYDNAGRSEGIADITFARLQGRMTMAVACNGWSECVTFCLPQITDAEMCIQEWNGLAIDEQLLDVKFYNPPPQSLLPLSQRLGKTTNIAARLGPLNVDTSAILKRLGGKVRGSSRGGRSGSGLGGEAAGSVLLQAKSFADAVPTDTRTVLDYGEIIIPPGI